MGTPATRATDNYSFVDVLANDRGGLRDEPDIGRRVGLARLPEARDVRLIPNLPVPHAVAKMLNDLGNERHPALHGMFVEDRYPTDGRGVGLRRIERITVAQVEPWLNADLEQTVHYVIEPVEVVLFPGRLTAGPTGLAAGPFDAESCGVLVGLGRVEVPAVERLVSDRERRGSDRRRRPRGEPTGHRQGETAKPLLSGGKGSGRPAVRRRRQRPCFPGERTVAYAPRWFAPIDSRVDCPLPQLSHGRSNGATLPERFFPAPIRVYAPIANCRPNPVGDHWGANPGCPPAQDSQGGKITGKCRPAGRGLARACVAGVTTRWS